MYFSRTFKALNFDFQIQGLSRTFKVRANPVCMPMAIETPDKNKRMIMRVNKNRFHRQKTGLTHPFSRMSSGSENLEAARRVSFLFPICLGRSKESLLVGKATVKTNIYSYNNLRHCRISFSPFVRQPFFKQLYNNSCYSYSMRC